MNGKWQLFLFQINLLPFACIGRNQGKFQKGKWKGGNEYGMKFKIMNFGWHNV